MEFNNLVEAIDADNASRTNKLIEKLTPRLIQFLRIHMNATRQDAEDCVQQALINGIEAVKEGKVRKSDQIVTFLLTTCRNNYLNLQKKNPMGLSGDMGHNFGAQPRQLQALLDQERRQHLEECLQGLSDSYRTFIDYWFSYPDSDATAAATRFGISVANVWTRKHRIIKKLSDCYQKKIKK